MCHGIIVIAIAAMLNVSRYYRYSNAKKRTNCKWVNDLFFISGISVSFADIIYVTEIQFTLPLPPFYVCKFPPS